MSVINELKLQAELDRKLGDLVRLSEKLVDDIGQGVGKLDPSQVRNVVAVANAAPHTAIVTNFIRYQMGRDATRGAWRDTKLGEKIVNAIDGDVQKWAQEMGRKANVEADQVHIRLTRLLLGFLNRRHVYLRSLVKGGEGHQ